MEPSRRRSFAISPFPIAAERILALAEKETEHRHGAEDLLVQEEVRASRTGQKFAFVLGIGSLAVIAVTSLATALAGSRKLKD